MYENSSMISVKVMHPLVEKFLFNDLNKTRNL